MESKSYKELKQEKWQGKFLKQRWDDEKLDNDCFQWMHRMKDGADAHNRRFARVISTAPSDQSLSSEQDGNQYHHRRYL